MRPKPFIFPFNPFYRLCLETVTDKRPPGLRGIISLIDGLQTVSVLRGAKDKYILALGHYFLEAVANLLFAHYRLVCLADIGSLNNQYIHIAGNMELVNHFAQAIAQVSMFTKITGMDGGLAIALNL